MHEREREIRITEPIVVPACWRDLLAIEDFDALPERPRRVRAIGCVHPAADPLPYVDDVREVAVEQDGVEVIVALLSGNANYWFSEEVVRASDRQAIACSQDAASAIEEGERKTSSCAGEIVVRYRVEVRP